MKVLIIDDEPHILKVASISLRRIGGCEVSVAENGAGGLAAAGAEKPDVILLDFQLPDTDGYQVLRQLKNDAATREIPVILCTASTEHADEARAVAAGAIGVIHKPFDPMRLAENMRHLLDEARNRA